jgi:hypothetical protein
VVLAEAQLALTEQMARHERIRIAVDRIDEAVQALQALQENDGDLSSSVILRQAAPLAATLRSELTVLLQASSGESPRVQRIDLLLEAHIYTNQLVTALGFPPLSQLNASFPSTEEEMMQALRNQDVDEEDIVLSPELERYFDTKNQEEAMLQQANRMAELRAQRTMLRRSIEAGQGHTEQGPPRTHIDRLYDGDYFPSGTVETRYRTFREALHTNEMNREYEEYEESVDRREALALAGRIFDLQLRIIRGRKEHWPLAGGLISRRRYTDTGDVRHIIDRDTLEEWNEEVRPLVWLPIKDVLALARYLDDHPPTNEEIQDWYSSNIYLSEVDRHFGPEGDRRNFTRQFLIEWLTLREYAEKYAPPERQFADDEALKLSEDGYPDFTLVYREGDQQWRLRFTYDYPTVSYGGTPRRESGMLVTRIEDGPLEQWGGSRRWRIWGHGFFTNEEFPKEVRDRLFDVMTTPHEEERYTFRTIDRILRLYPYEATAKYALEDRLQIMYQESWNKQFFLKLLMTMITANGAEITDDTWEQIYNDMRKAQELGHFAYIPG